MFYIFWFLIGGAFCMLDRLQGWNYINLHCRDHDNAPVDWWVIYKPPAGLGPWETGANFSYISAQSAGAWVPSERLITASTMLQHTLSPMYRQSYVDYLAVLTYHPREGHEEQQAGSVAMGVMMADEMGGVWIAHTVPGLPDISRDRFKFPEEELVNGHLIFCLSGGFVTLNEIAKTLREVEPRVMEARVPAKVREWLPDWLSLNEPVRLPLSSKSLPSKTSIVSSGNSLRGELMVRRPGDTRCLYQLFAQSRNIVLDVYGHHQLAEPICDKKYGLRKIDAISLNYPNAINDNNKHIQVVYVNNQTDKVEFAVSTAAPWQKKGSSPKPEYWACIGNAAKAYGQAKGGFILCLENYDFWRSFDILKVKEPECYCVVLFLK